MPRVPRKIPLLDLNESAFHMLHGDEPELVLEPGGRVTLQHEAGDLFYSLARRYNENEPVPVQDFVRCLRQLRSRLMTMKAGNKEVPIAKRHPF